MDRNAQFAPAYTALDADKAATVAFDAATATLEAAQADATAKFRAYNQVAWMLGPDARGAATDEQKIAALQLKIAYENAEKLLPGLMATATAASQARGAAFLKLLGIVQSLQDNPGAVENTSGTPL